MTLDITMLKLNYYKNLFLIFNQRHKLLITVHVILTQKSLFFLSFYNTQILLQRVKNNSTGIYKNKYLVKNILKEWQGQHDKICSAKFEVDFLDLSGSLLAVAIFVRPTI